jgi:hypothetical protein
VAACAPCQFRTTSPRARSSRKERGVRAWGIDTCVHTRIYTRVDHFFQVPKIRRWERELLDIFFLILSKIKGLRIF